MNRVLYETKIQTLLTVAECRNYTRAAERMSLTQPAVSHQIRQLEEEIGAPLFVHAKNGLELTAQGKIVVRYARRYRALNEKMMQELKNAERCLTTLRVGITHTSESNLTAQVLAKYCTNHSDNNIIIFTDTQENLYDMLTNYEIDIAFVEKVYQNQKFASLMLGTDCLVCAMAPENDLASKPFVTLGDLRSQNLILRLPTSATRSLFESSLESRNDSIRNYRVTMEVDNIATIKDLIRLNYGVSILPRSACMDEIRKGKIIALPVENMSMVREMHIVYNQSFSHPEILEEIVSLYQGEMNA